MERGQRAIHGCEYILSGVLIQIKITAVNGTDTFDAGEVNMTHE
ncbi:MAG: hypothetical protein ABI377_09080 [Devosia sp.]